MTTRWDEVSEPCRLGYEEYDGARYCHAHGGFLEPGIQSRRCDRYAVASEADLPDMWSQSDFLGGERSPAACPNCEHPMTRHDADGCEDMDGNFSACYCVSQPEGSAS